MLILSKRRFNNWWQLARIWFERQFAVLVNEVRNSSPEIDIDTSELAKQGNNPNATNSAILAAFRSIDFSELAKETTAEAAKEAAQSAATAAGQAKDTATQAATDAALAKQAAQAITGYALQGSGNNTLTDIYTLIGYTISVIDGV